jgi:hypothetical protein
MLRAFLTASPNQSTDTTIIHVHVHRWNCRRWSEPRPPVSQRSSPQNHTTTQTRINSKTKIWVNSTQQLSTPRQKIWVVPPPPIIRGHEVWSTASSTRDASNGAGDVKSGRLSMAQLRRFVREPKWVLKP